MQLGRWDRGCRDPAEIRFGLGFWLVPPHLELGHVVRTPAVSSAVRVYGCSNWESAAFLAVSAILESRIGGWLLGRASEHPVPCSNKFWGAMTNSHKLQNRWVRSTLGPSKAIQ